MSLLALGAGAARAECERPSYESSFPDLTGQKWITESAPCTTRYDRELEQYDSLARVPPESEERTLGGDPEVTCEYFVGPHFRKDAARCLKGDAKVCHAIGDMVHTADRGEVDVERCPGPVEGFGRAACAAGLDCATLALLDCAPP